MRKPYRFRRRHVPLLLLVIASVVTYFYRPQNGKSSSIPAAGQYFVSHVDDGDTIKVKGSGGKTDTVRLIGIDTPETKDPRKPIQCFGQAASAKTKELAEGKTVRLEADPTNSDRDKYHRLLRYVYLPDGIMLNRYLVQNGYAFAYTVFPNEHLDEFRQLEKNAREHSLGLWAGCQINESTQIKQTNPQ